VAKKGEKRRRPMKIGTINRNLGAVRRVLNLCARLWRDKDTNLSWLAQAPLIQMLDEAHARVAYPIDWAEQDLMFSELNELLRT
jgi:hypothetical protein